MTRRFSTTPLPRELVTELCDLARRAPSAGFSQGVHLLALDGAGLERFWDLSGAGGWFAQSSPGVLAAPVVVLAVADPTAYTRRYAEGDKAGHGLEDAAAWPVPYWLTDCAMAVQNLLLLAQERGLGALLFGVFGDHEVVRAGFGIPIGTSLVGAVALGHRAPDDVASGSATRRPRRPVEEVVHWNTW